MDIGLMEFLHFTCRSILYTFDSILLYITCRVWYVQDTGCTVVGIPRAPPLSPLRLLSRTPPPLPPLRLPTPLPPPHLPSLCLPTRTTPLPPLCLLSRSPLRFPVRASLPVIRAGHAAVWDEERGGMWLHGGYTTFFPYISSAGAGSDYGTTVTWFRSIQSNNCRKAVSVRCQATS